MTYAIMIKKDNSTNAKITDIEKYLKTEFKNYSHLLGFCEGYLFDNFQIWELSKLEEKINKFDIEKWFIKFATIEELEEE